jgi:antitoxin component YwqK of YwqJK toxin-antitoxin module
MHEYPKVHFNVASWNLLITKVFNLRNLSVSKIMEQDYTEHKTTHPWGYEIFFLKDRKKEGVCKSYNNNGVLLSISNYKNGKLDGEYRSFYQNGLPEIICNYKNGLLNGKYERTTKYGREEHIYVDGKKHGYAVVYHNNGKLWIDTSYINDMLDGPYISFNEDGTERFCRYYSKGVRQI